MNKLEGLERLIIRSQATTAFLRAMHSQEKVKVLKEVPFPDRALIEETEALFDAYRREHRELCAQVSATPNI